MSDTAKRTDQADWPKITSETRPWTRWWWLGAAVDKPTLTRLLETYRAAGFGGVEVTSIYGVKGQEHRNIEYLSPQWLAMLRHTIAEARRLGMQVDLPPGSGWRIGGPFITDATSAAKLVVEADGSAAPTVRCEVTDEKVKRAGPGGRGRAFNPFSRASIQAAIDYFTPALTDLDIRAQFHDSWEYQTNACPELFDTFAQHCGYDLRDHADALADPDPANDEHARVRYDLHHTLDRMALENFIEPWAEWCHELGQLSRNQAHGTPGNLVDFYAAADIPETELFREPAPDTVLRTKFASSGGHLAGRRLASSETGTWMNENFHGTLAQMRRCVDILFVAGINHHVYHGTAYSPEDAEWPGWVFYASTHFNPQNPIWRDLPTLNAYVTRCQSILQSGDPDNDLLVYFPIHDVFQDPQHPFGARLAIGGDWFKSLSAAATITRLWDEGYSFDYISDAWLKRLDVSTTPYRAIVVPPCRFIPEDTLKALAKLADHGLPVFFVPPIPQDVPGLSDLAARRSRFNQLTECFEPVNDLDAALAAVHISREPAMSLPGLQLIRRRHDHGRYCFITNQGDAPINAWTELATPFHTVVRMDPMTGERGLAQTDGQRVRLQLAAGESCVVRTVDTVLNDLPPWPYREPAGEPCALEGAWEVAFLEGGPELPTAFETSELRSWTERGGAAEAFAGTARYRLTFDAPGNSVHWLLDLGEVRESARVRLNGDDIGTLIGPSYCTTLHDLTDAGNVLEVEVTNIAANRIRDLDRRGVAWRIFEDINFVARGYGPFDASDWPVTPAGLLGPVTLTPLHLPSGKT